MYLQLTKEVSKGREHFGYLIESTLELKVDALAFWSDALDKALSSIYLLYLTLPYVPKVHYLTVPY